MPIFFKPSASDFSLSADSIGNRWLQEPVVRPNGFPLYHWIQTERGEGLLTLEGQKLLLSCEVGCCGRNKQQQLTIWMKI